MTLIPTNLYYIYRSSSDWRKAYLLIYNIYGSDVPDISKSLDKRDLLPKFGLPVEAWIDLRIIDRWFKEVIPIPLVAIFHYLLNIQKEDGSLSIDGVIPNSGATYRTIELALLLGLWDNTGVRKAVEFLTNSLKNGGLASPGPVEGALLEVGTTARFLYILKTYQSTLNTDKYADKIMEMENFILSRVFIHGEEAAWHTDLHPMEVGDIDRCITGATSLALFALNSIYEDGNQNAELIQKVCRWLVRQQKDDGGWSDAKDGLSNVDNTFNVVRALISSLPKLEGEVKKQVETSLEKTKEFLRKTEGRNLNKVSLKAMLLRARLMLWKNPMCSEVMEALEDLIKAHSEWYHPSRHIYNEILISAVAIAEWLRALRKANIDPYREAKREKQLRFLFAFPVEIPPFFPGHKEALSEKFLNFITKAKCGHSVITTIVDSITLRDTVAIVMSIFLMLGVFFSEDFINAVLLPQADGRVNFLSTFVMLFIYLGWILLKFRVRESFFNFLATTMLSVLVSYLLIAFWLRFVNASIYDAIQKNAPWSFIKLLLTYALIIDVGRRLINVSEIDKILLSRRGRR